MEETSKTGIPLQSNRYSLMDMTERNPVRRFVKTENKEQAGEGTHAVFLRAGCQITDGGNSVKEMLVFIYFKMRIEMQTTKRLR